MSAFDRADSRVPLALCGHYFSAHFETQRVQVLMGNGSTAEQWVHWAVGVLGDGNWEALGAWSVASVGPALWRGISDDFGNRGVARIELVCVPGLEATHNLFRTVKVLPPFRRILGTLCVADLSDVALLRSYARRAVRQASGVRAARVALESLLAESEAERALVLSQDWPEVLAQFEPFYALRLRHRKFVRTGDEHLERMGLSLRRAIDRHGVFPDLAAATSFVADTLAHDERRLSDRALSAFEWPVAGTSFPITLQCRRIHGRRGSLDGR